MKNKIIAMLLCLTIGCTFASCGGDDSEKTSRSAEKKDYESEHTVTLSEPKKNSYRHEEKNPPANAAENACGDDITWRVEGTALYLEGNGNMWDYEYELKRPWHSYTNDITEIFIDEKILTVGDYAFSGFKSLERVVLHNDLLYIGESAFEDCTSLEDVVLPSKLATINQSSFNGTAIKSITIPNGVYFIDNCAFANCTYLETIEIPDSVTAFGGQAFFKSGLKQLSVSKYVEGMGKDAIGVCFNLERIDVDKDNEHFMSVDGVLYNKAQTELICFPKNSALTSLVFPENLTSVSEQLSFCTNLKNVTINGNMETVPSYLFNGAELDSVRISDGVKKLDGHSFYGCNLKTLYLPASITEIGNSAFKEKETTLSDVYYEGSEEDWDKINIKYYNDVLWDAYIHFNSK